MRTPEVERVFAERYVPQLKRRVCAKVAALNNLLPTSRRFGE